MATRRLPATGGDTATAAVAVAACAGTVVFVAGSSHGDVARGGW